MAQDFIVNISRLTSAVTQKGFGTILIALTGASAGQAALGYKLYESIADLAVDYTGTEAENIATIIFSQRPRPAQIAVVSTEAVDAAGLLALLNSVSTEDFFGLCISDNTLRATASTFADANKRLFAVTTEDLAATSVSENTILGYHNDIDNKNYVAEALMTHLLVRIIGSTTGKARVLQGIEAAEISTTDLNTLDGNNALTYIEKMGVTQTTEGKVASGEYIDVILGSYFIEFRVSEGLAALLVNTPKIPYSNTGIAQLRSVVSKVLDIATEQGIVLIDEETGEGVYTIVTQSRNEVLENDIANRVYNGLSFEATLAGAIHEGVINGVLVL